MGLIKSNDVPLSLAAFSMKDIEAQAATVLARAKEKADGMIAQARTEAANIKRVAQIKALAEGLKQGKAQGLEEGKKTGHATALVEHSAAMTELVKTLSRAIGELEEHRDQLLTQGLREVVELACSVARRITKRQGLLEPEVLLENLKEAMSHAVHAADIRLAVHPSQLKTLQAELPNLRIAWPRLKHVELVEDSTISPGGAKIYTLHGEVNGDLEAQLDRMVAELMPDRAAGMP
jgi:flagellar assembly protein FliH